jgi:metacaspase-1
VSDVSNFQLPDAAGRAGGALTSTLLNIIYADHHDTRAEMSYKDVMDTMRAMMQQNGFEQIPQVPKPFLYRFGLIGLP